VHRQSDEGNVASVICNTQNCTEQITEPPPRKRGSRPTTNIMAASRMLELTEIIAANTKKVDEFFRAEGMPDLSFNVDAPGDFPVLSSNTEIQQARRAIVNATQELHDLMVGPRETVRWLAWSVSTYISCCVTIAPTFRPTCINLDPRHFFILITLVT
jgi:hypothetical protein